MSQGRAVLFKVFHGVVVKHAVTLEETVDLMDGAEAEHAAQLRVRDVPALIFFQRQCFEGAARQIAARRFQPGEDFIGNVNGQIHLSIYAPPLSPRQELLESGHSADVIFTTAWTAIRVGQPNRAHLRIASIAKCK